MLASRLGVESQGPRTWDILTELGLRLGLDIFYLPLSTEGND